MNGSRQRKEPGLDIGLLHADEDDRPAVRSSSRPVRAYLNVLALLVITGAAVYWLLLLNGVLGNDAALSVKAPVVVRQPGSIPVPPIYTTDALSTPKPLADCIKPDNIIDEVVATCRYGYFPRATEASTAQGMVSASYMAKYKAEQQQPARTRRAVASNVERATVWQWDGKRTYAAQWTITDNRIEGSSVCANYRRGSIEYRECRKGAKVYFREKCREWGNRRSQQRSDASQAIEQRFCSAGNGFNPLG